jgi:hypothetical protein
MGIRTSSINQHHPTTKISPHNWYVPTHTHYLNENGHVTLLCHQLNDGSPTGYIVKCQITEDDLICECEGCHTKGNLLPTDEEP